MITGCVHPEAAHPIASLAVAAAVHGANSRNVHCECLIIMIRHPECCQCCELRSTLSAGGRRNHCRRLVHLHAYDQHVDVCVAHLEAGVGRWSWSETSQCTYVAIGAQLWGSAGLGNVFWRVAVLGGRCELLLWQLCKLERENDVCSIRTGATPRHWCSEAAGKMAQPQQVHLTVWPEAICIWYTPVEAQRAL